MITAYEKIENKSERLSNAFCVQVLQLIDQISDQQHLSLMLEHQEKHDWH